MTFYEWWNSQFFEYADNTHMFYARLAWEAAQDQLKQKETKQVPSLFKPPIVNGKLNAE